MSSTSDHPLISIGMPVRNEATFLRATLDALVAQEGVNLEIIISDNASTDDTGLICQDYCTRHPFIRYQRREANVGASANFAFVLQEASGEYFMWASGHDLWDKDYLRNCLQALQQNSGAVIAFGSTHWIDADGESFPRQSGWTDTRGMSDVGRYFAVFWGNMNPIIALIRTEALRKHKIEDMVGVDLAILLGLALQGDFVHAWQTRWFRREFRRETSYEQKLQRYRGKDYALGTSVMARWFPLARLPARIISDLLGSTLPFGRRLLMLAVLTTSLPIKYLVDKSRRTA